MAGVRIDKYLWAIRLYKTRSISAEACKNGRVKIDDVAVKASREVKVGDVIELRVNIMNKVIEVVDVIKNRMSASLAVQKYKDITPQEELERVEMINEMRTEHRDRGAGRPTKKDRRELSKIKMD
ncbi:MULTISPECIES: RNA-binding S4 domain-containing protein [unclassified Lentimicrobium]|uniref:RNA-binding S4 domain-containing protein n=1 Tax=unclassified Lentimicrobium TaxID=2677434 RepID=UPI001556A088|nr:MULTISPECIES: RNA-binding S4 domain-containing protein [unclassified Lentimicrobium]NPD45443.1 RNA-binding S4 domain-containing protein [Lentimicrobium sp. S6]NPD83805.1 RNA-binding S4 domain-containing protein [Lentimicrobium sp. L6]